MPADGFGPASWPANCPGASERIAPRARAGRSAVASFLSTISTCLISVRLCAPAPDQLGGARRPPGQLSVRAPNRLERAGSNLQRELRASSVRGREQALFASTCADCASQSVSGSERRNWRSPTWLPTGAQSAFSRTPIGLHNMQDEGDHLLRANKPLEQAS